MNDKEDKIETVMKADLRSCISTTSDRAQLIIEKKKKTSISPSAVKGLAEESRSIIRM